MAFGRSPGVFVDSQPAGSACCVWRDGLRTYVLTAAHVVAPLAESSIVEWRSQSGDASGFGQTLDSSFHWVPVDGGNLDAAPIPIASAGPFASAAGYPSGSRIVEWSDILDSQEVMVCGKHATRFATLDRRVGAGQVSDLSGHVHGRLLRFRFDDIQTMPGDSGCPVISMPEGLLIGMHLGLDSADQRFSLAVSAADVRNAFFFRLPGFDLRP